MLDYINKHKGISIVVGLSIILLIIMIVIFVSLFFGGGGGVYGNRLKGIEEVEISTKDMSNIASSIEEKEEVESANVRLQGKIVYIIFELKSEVSVDTAKLIASNTLEKFSTEELAFYDICDLVKWTDIVEEKEVVRAIEGTKHHQKETITWSKS